MQSPQLAELERRRRTILSRPPAASTNDTLSRLFQEMAQAREKASRRSARKDSIEVIAFHLAALVEELKAAAAKGLVRRLEVQLRRVQTMDDYLVYEVFTYPYARQLFLQKEIRGVLAELGSALEGFRFLLFKALPGQAQAQAGTGASISSPAWRLAEIQKIDALAIVRSLPTIRTILAE